MKEAGILGSWLLGVLLSLSLYLYFAAGDGIVSLNAVQPAFMISLAAIPLIFLSPNLENRLTSLAIFIGFLICIVGLFFIFALTFGLVFSDWASAGSAVPYFPLFVAIYFVLRNYKLAPHILIGFLLSFPIIVWMVKDYESRRIDRKIQRTINSGGCVLLRVPKYFCCESSELIRTVSEIPLGTFVGHNYPRIYFVKKSGIQDWSYSKSEAQMYRGTPMPCPNYVP